MKLIKALITDSFDLKNICIDAYSKNFYNHWNDGGLKWYLKTEFSTERLNADLLDNNTDYYFIKHEQQTIGFIKIRNNLDVKLSIENAVELEKIYVLPEYKGKGIGKLALKEIIKITKERGKKNLFLCVIDTNKSAIKFYEKMDFKFHSKTRLDVPYFKEELKGMIRMVKVLNKLK